MATTAGAELRLAVTREEVEAAWQLAGGRGDALPDELWRAFVVSARQKLDVRALLVECGVIGGGGGGGGGGARGGGGSGEGGFGRGGAAGFGSARGGSSGARRGARGGDGARSSRGSATLGDDGPLPPHVLIR